MTYLTWWYRFSPSDFPSLAILSNATVMINGLIIALLSVLEELYSSQLRNFAESCWNSRFTIGPGIRHWTSYNGTSQPTVPLVSVNDDTKSQCATLHTSILRHIRRHEWMSFFIDSNLWVNIWLSRCQDLELSLWLIIIESFTPHQCYLPFVSVLQLLSSVGDQGVSLRRCTYGQVIAW